MAEKTALIRTFIGVDIPTSTAFADVLRDLDAMGRAIKTVDSSSMHVTLKFLGDTPVDQIDEIGSAIAKIASSHDRFLVKLHGVGVFPHEQRPSVLWIGMRHAETLVDMVGEIERRLSDFNFAPERRAFSPHLTLARVKARPPQSLFDLLSAHQEREFGEFAVDAVTLYQSELTPKGAVYTVLKKCPLRSD